MDRPAFYRGEDDGRTGRGGEGGKLTDADNPLSPPPSVSSQFGEVRGGRKTEGERAGERERGRQHKQ